MGTLAIGTGTLAWNVKFLYSVSPRICAHRVGMKKNSNMYLESLFPLRQWMLSVMKGLMNDEDRAERERHRWYPHPQIPGSRVHGPGWPLPRTWPKGQDLEARLHHWAFGG